MSEIVPIDESFDFSKWIQHEMDKREWDKYDLSIKSGLSTQAIYLFQRSGRLPKMETMEMLLNAMGKHLVIVDN